MSADSVVPRRTMRDLAYHFNDEGQLRTILGNQPFVFTTQAGYELLGEAMTHDVYDLLEQLGLKRLPLKKLTDDGPDSEYSFVFASADYDKKDVLLVLMHGSGAVRAGQWSRRLIMNEDLDKGSQIPYIEKALSLGYGVVVFNSNNNSNKIGSNVVPLKYSRSPDRHCFNAWIRFVSKSRCETIYVVAHSRGGADISGLMASFPYEKRVRAICLTDSWYRCPRTTNQPIVINWAARPKEDLERPTVRENRRATASLNKVHQIWAGTEQHERSSYSAMESIFHVLTSKPTLKTLDKLLVEAWDIVDPVGASKSALSPETDTVKAENVCFDRKDTDGPSALEILERDLVETRCEEAGGSDDVDQSTAKKARLE